MCSRLKRSSLNSGTRRTTESCTGRNNKMSGRHTDSVTKKCDENQENVDKAVSPNAGKDVKKDTAKKNAEAQTYNTVADGFRH